MRAILFMSTTCGGCHTAKQMLDRAKPPGLEVDAHYVDKGDPQWGALFRQLGGQALPGLAVDRFGNGQWHLVPAASVLPVLQGRVRP